jgi:hypothetical protein
LHLPYFYEGFLGQDAMPPVADGDFVLALSLRNATAVRLSLRNLSAMYAEIECGSVRRRIDGSDAVETDVPIGPAQQNDMLHVRLSPRSRIAVLRAVVLTAEGARS